MLNILTRPKKDRRSELEKTIDAELERLWAHVDNEADFDDAKKTTIRNLELIRSLKTITENEKKFKISGDAIFGGIVTLASIAGIMWFEQSGHVFSSKTAAGRIPR